MKINDLYHEYKLFYSVALHFHQKKQFKTKFLNNTDATAAAICELIFKMAQHRADFKRNLAEVSQ